jgi:hypothetical protein
MHPKAKLLYDKRNDIGRELNLEYYKLLSEGKTEKIISDYNFISEKLPTIQLYERPQNLSAEEHVEQIRDNKEYLTNMGAFLRTAEDSFKKCEPLIEKLKKQDLNSEDKFNLSDMLASAKSCIDALIAFD